MTKYDEKKDIIFVIAAFIIPLGMAITMDLMNIECNALQANLLYGGFIVGIIEGFILSHFY